MKCQHCRWLPAAGPEGDADECPYYEKYGTVWKDGSDGCTLHPNQIKKFEDEYAEYLGDMGTDMGVDMDLVQRGVDKQKVIDYCKHMIGMDNKGTYHRHGKEFYRPYRNYWAGKCKELDAMPNYLIEKCISANSDVALRDIEYHLTAEGKRWLGRQLHITIKEGVP